MTESTSTTQQPNHFNSLARWLHWLMAAMVMAMLFIGVGMMTSLNHRLLLMDLHKPLGICILALAVLRIANRLLTTAPKMPSAIPRWQVAAAKASHLVLYTLIVLMPVVGWAVLSAGGYPVSLSEGMNLPPIVPPSATTYAWLRDAHKYMALMLFAVVALHLSAALMHAWIYRDSVFSSMARGRQRQIK